MAAAISESSIDLMNPDENLTLVPASLFLTMLPPELHLEICKNLPYPTLVELRAVNQYFSELLTPWFMSKREEETRQELYQNEMESRPSAMMFTRGHRQFNVVASSYDCYQCLKRKPLSQFPIGQIYRKQNLKGVDALKRHCIPCAIKKQQTPGTIIEAFAKRAGDTQEYNLMSWIVCSCCNTLRESNLQSRRWKMCVGCWRGVTEEGRQTFEADFDLSEDGAVVNDTLLDSPPIMNWDEGRFLWGEDRVPGARTSLRRGWKRFVGGIKKLLKKGDGKPGNASEA